jgi:hypothetical protein
MEENNVIKFVEPGTFVDGLTEVLRNGARKLLTQAVETEVAEFIGRNCDFVTEEGRRRVVRHGHLPEREIMTGIGPVPVRAPRIRDRVGQGETRIRFLSAILPSYARRSKSLSARCLAKTPAVCRLRPSPGSKMSGQMSTSSGKSVICQRSATFICGLTASMSKLVLRTTRNACWSLSVRQRKAKRSLSA